MATLNQDGDSPAWRTMKTNSNKAEKTKPREPKIATSTSVNIYFFFENCCPMTNASLAEREKANVE